MLIQKVLQKLYLNLNQLNDQLNLKNVKDHYWYKSPLDKSNSKLKCIYMVHVQSKKALNLANLEE